MKFQERTQSGRTVTPRAAARQAPLSMEFSRTHRSGLPFSSLGMGGRLSHPGLPRCGRILHSLSHRGSPVLPRYSNFGNGSCPSVKIGAFSQKSSNWHKVEILSVPLETVRNSDTCSTGYNAQNHLPQEIKRSPRALNVPSPTVLKRGRRLLVAGGGEPGPGF